MKYLFTLIFALITVVVYGQAELPMKDGKVTVDGVLPVLDSASKDVLYKRAKKWFVTTYKSANDVIQFDDPEGGEIIGKGNFNVKFGSREPRIDHTITVAVKDGKYRYIITNLVYTDNQGKTFPLEEYPKDWMAKQKLYDAVNTELKGIVLSLFNAMQPIGKKDDW